VLLVERWHCGKFSKNSLVYINLKNEQYLELGKTATPTSASTVARMNGASATGLSLSQACAVISGPTLPRGHPDFFRSP